MTYRASFLLGGISGADLSAGRVRILPLKRNHRAYQRVLSPFDAPSVGPRSVWCPRAGGHGPAEQRRESLAASDSAIESVSPPARVRIAVRGASRRPVTRALTVPILTVVPLARTDLDQRSLGSKPCPFPRAGRRPHRATWPEARRRGEGRLAPRPRRPARSEQQLGFFGPYNELSFEEKVGFYRDRRLYSRYEDCCFSA